MAVIHNDWSATTAYTSGAFAKLDGVLYQALRNIASNASNMEPRLDTTRWKVAGVLAVSTYYSLIESIRLQLNLTAGSDDILQSIPMFIQLAEESFKTRLRVPDQRTRVVLLTDAEGKITKPELLPDVINMRINRDDGGNFELTSRGTIQIDAADYQSYQQLLQIYTTTYYFRPEQEGYEYPVYWETPTQYCIAPLLDTGTEIELWYLAEIANLGSLDSMGATVLTNWFLTEAPQMLLYGALLEAAPYLNNIQDVQLWQQKFEKAEAETRYKIELSESSGPHRVYMNNFYST